MLLGVGAIGIFAGFKSALAGWTTGQQFVGEQHNARVVLDWMTRRLRMAGNEYPGARFAYANTSEIVFYGNTDADPAFECFRFHLGTDAVTGTPVVKVNTTEAACAGGDGESLTAGAEAKNFSVTGLTLRYFDGGAGAGTQLTALPLNSLDRAKIRRIEVEIRVAGVQPGTSVTMMTQVDIRR